MEPIEGRYTSEHTISPVEPCSPGLEKVGFKQTAWVEKEGLLIYAGDLLNGVEIWTLVDARFESPWAIDLSVVIDIMPPFLSTHNLASLRLKLFAPRLIEFCHLLMCCSLHR